MGFKTGLAVGLGAGYVLGTRAGRQRFEQIRGWWAQVTGSPTVQRAADRTKGVAGEQGKRALSVVQRGVEKAGSTVKDRLNRGTGTTGMAEPWGGSQVEVTPSVTAQPQVP
jgi:hypothetical protein